MWLLRLGCVVALLCAATPVTASAAGWSPCAGRPTVDCAQLDVPLDRSGAVPGTVSLHLERWLAPAARGVMVLLAGGPGQAATHGYDVSASYLHDRFPGYTLVAFDARGTGDSGLLRCPELEGGDGSLRSCAERIGERRRFYATADTVDDLESVRAALRTGRLALSGASYGTKVALDYAAAYPDHVERLLLDSVVPPTGPDALGLPMLRSVRRVAAAMCPPVACRRATRDFASDLIRLANRIGMTPLRGTVVDASGRRVSDELWGSWLLSFVSGSDGNPGTRAELPAAVRAALAGRPRPLLRLVHALGETAGPGDPQVFSPATFAATLCEDGRFPWQSGVSEPERSAALSSAVASLPAGAAGPFGGWATSVGTASYCVPWPESAARPAARTLPDIPVLALAGDLDLRTPLSDAAAVVDRFPRGRLLVAHGVGHSVLSLDSTRCAENAVRSWLDGSTPRASCPRAPVVVPVVPALPKSLAAAPAVRLRGVAGRTLSAVRAALAEARAAASLATVQSGWGVREVAIPGVYGGRLVLQRGAGRVDLAHYCVVPGVTLTGRLSVRDDPLAGRLAGTVKIRGRGAHGALELGATGSLRGVLGGRRVVSALPR